MAGEQIIAKKSDWTTQKMPWQKKSFTFRRHFSEEEIERLKTGHIPREMEDKWFWYFDDGKLYAHRSWTGVCIYIVAFHFDKDVHKATVNRNRREYLSGSVREEEKTLNTLLDWWAREPYDCYNEWLDETVSDIQKGKE